MHYLWSVIFFVKRVLVPFFSQVRFPIHKIYSLDFILGHQTSFRKLLFHFFECSSTLSHHTGIRLPTDPTHSGLQKCVEIYSLDFILGHQTSFQKLLFHFFECSSTLSHLQGYVSQQIPLIQVFKSVLRYFRERIQFDSKKHTCLVRISDESAFSAVQTDIYRYVTSASSLNH